MVSPKEHEGETIFICDLCGFGYKDRDTAESCEEYCAEYNSCSIEITRSAVYFPKLHRCGGCESTA